MSDGPRSVDPAPGQPEPRRASAREPARRSPLPTFLLGFALLVGAAVGGKLVWLSTFDLWPAERRPLDLGITPDFLSTGGGPFHRDHPVTQNVLRILYPGYEAELRRIRPPLSERDQFAVLSLMLDDGRTIRINIPAHLPFQLAEAAVPDALVLGSSRPREAIRPDVLAAELPGVERVINASVSAAVMRTMELMLDRFSSAIGDRKVEVLIIAVDNFSFTAFEGNYRDWLRNVRELDEQATLRGRLVSGGRRFLQYLPQIERNTAEPLEPFVRCPDSVVAETLASFEPELHHLYDDGVSLEEVEALRRITRKAGEVANHVYYVTMPVLPVMRRFAAREFPFEPYVERIIGERWIRIPEKAWGFQEADFFGSLGRSACSFDAHHMNPAASPRFTRTLADVIRRDLQNSSTRSAGGGERVRSRREGEGHAS